MNKTIVIIFLSLIIAGLLSLSFYLRNEIIRFEGNYDKVVNDKESAEILHKGELKKYHAAMDSIAKKYGVRDKTVKVVFQTKYIYKDSAVILPFYEYKTFVDTIPLWYKEYRIDKPCYSLSIKQVNDTISEKLQFHNIFTGILHWERPHKFWFIRWGAKEYFLKLHSNCDNDTVKVGKLIIQE